MIVSSVPSISKDVSGLGDSWQAWQRVWIRENMQMYAFYCLAIAPLCVSYNTLCRVGNYFNSIHSCAKLVVKLIYSEKATKFCEISTLLLSYAVPVKSNVEILQNFVAFSEYMNFIFFMHVSLTSVVEFWEHGSTEFC